MLDAVCPRWPRDTVLFLAGQTVSLLGSSIVGYAVIWYITLKTGSGAQYALLVIAAQLTQGLTSIPGGVWADRYPRKLLIIGSDGLIALFTLGLALYFLRGHEAMVVIVVVLALRGLLSGVQSPAVNAALPQLVPAKHLLRVNSLNSAAQALIFVAAPAIAAVLLVKVPLGWIFLVDVATAAIGIGFILLVRLPRLVVADAPGRPAGWRSYGHDMGQAIQAVRHHPGLWRVLGIMAFMMCVLIPVAQLTPVFITRYFGAAQWMLATGEIIWSAGSVIGGLVMTAWGGLRNRMALIMWASAAGVLFATLMGASPTFWIFCLSALLWGGSIPFLEASSLTAAQENIEPHLLGRVMGLYTLIMAVSGPLGMAVVGPLSDAVSLRLLCFLTAGLSAVFLAVLQLRGGPGAVLLAKPVLPVDE